MVLGAPPAGLEPAHLASEASALSAELQGPLVNYSKARLLEQVCGLWARTIGDRRATGTPVPPHSITVIFGEGGLTTQDVHI